MGKIYCTECGTELDDSSLFCSNCGNPTKPYGDNVKETDNTNANSTNDLFNNILNQPKIIMLVVVTVAVVLLIVGVFSLMGNGGNLVDVTDVIYETKISYGDTPFGGATGKTNNAGKYYSAVAFKIIPKETISGVNSFRVDNFKIIYENGKTEDLGTITFDNKNSYLQGNQYTFSYKYYLNEDVSGQKVHIKGDIVVDTLNQQNKVIGHLDYDTTAGAYSARY